MRISMLCFSRAGWKTGKRLADELGKAGYAASLDAKSKYLPDSITESHTDWTARQFGYSKSGDKLQAAAEAASVDSGNLLHPAKIADAIIFIGACGIAVRSIAPFVKNKKKDPAVLVVDECGKFVISLLSGHLGGANELAEYAAEILGAIPVITTATDIHRRFAVDVFAKKNHCAIFPLNTAKAFSAALLEGEPVGFYSDFPWEGDLPRGLMLCDRWGRPIDSPKSDGSAQSVNDKQKPQIGIAVSIYRDCVPFSKTVHVVPRIVSLGLGCRKGKDAEGIRLAAKASITEGGLFQDALAHIASIDLKKKEPGILALAEKWEIPFQTYDADTLKNAKGTFSQSSFVASVTGVDNVCERSAVLASGQGKLIQKKKGEDGVTTALAVKDWRIRFE